MSLRYNCSLFIFRRDLRCADNTGLIAAARNSTKIIPCFIFDPRQVGKENKYRSDNAVQFMIESLNELVQELKDHDGKLYFFYGKAHEVVENICKMGLIDAIFFNQDYTPFSKQRDDAIVKVAARYDVSCMIFDDLLLHLPTDVLKKNGEPYSVFTPFYKNAQKLMVNEAHQFRYNNFYTQKIDGSYHNIPPQVTWQENKNIHVHGGRSVAQKILRSLKKFSNYQSTHDFPEHATSNLSAHNKFGTLSIREVYHAIGKTLGYEHPLIRQLYWRDFFSIIAFYFPRVFGHAYHEKYDRIAWSTNKKKFEQWCQGLTGFPMVDAGMRQLNETGFMHNRVRMIVASFLVKDLHISWLWGERYFAQKLVDYDPAVNNGNWQWAASTGTDAQPYFRIFNPWQQQIKFDPMAKYIKKWIPELVNLTPKQIHQLDRKPQNVDYPRPIIDHQIERSIALESYKKI